MRYYPEQKTRALKPAGRKEDEALRQREAPFLSQLPRAPTRAAARVARIVIKGMHGGYGTRVPHHMSRWLETMTTPR